MAQPVAARIRLAGQTPAGLAAGPCALAVADAEDVLRRGGGVAGLGVEAAGRGLGVAQWASALVACTVLGDGGPVGLGGDEQGEAAEDEGRGEMHCCCKRWRLGWRCRCCCCCCCVVAVSDPSE